MIRATARNLPLIFVAWFAVTASAYGQNLQEKVRGTWTFVSGADHFPDGKKLSSWTRGNLILDSSGHVSLLLIADNRPKASPNIRTPVGPAIAFFGTYTTDEATGALTFKIDYGSSPLFDGDLRTQKVSFSGDTMVLTGSVITTPAGPLTPVNEWKKLN